MITPKTQAAIAILYSIYANGGNYISTNASHAPAKIIHELLGKLKSAELIQLANEEKPEEVTSYIPVREMKDISLLDILEATGEHLNCNHPTTETFYARYGRAAQKLGVVNHMTRVYLKDIKLIDL